MLHTQMSFIPSTWLKWLLDQGIELAIIIVVAFLVPRIGRLSVRLITRHLDPTEQESKQRLAIVGTAVYLVQLIAYFFLSIAALKELGIPLAGAAIPATVVSAAVGLGAQSIIADFLAGFFIISEKQFGVGDWVRFEGSGIDIEGDVIQITMRATRVRTLAGETVTIPNSTARVCINHSNYWARAVVTMPIPLLGSDSIDHAVQRSTDATLRALEQPEIAGDVTGELDVHPSVGVEGPQTVGMPWMVDMRFIVQVHPARQWAVERAIRTRIIEEFWAEYGSATTISGAVRETLEADAPQIERAFTRTPLIDVNDDPSVSTRNDMQETPENQDTETTGESNSPAQVSGVAATAAGAGAATVAMNTALGDGPRGTQRPPTQDKNRSRSDISTNDPTDPSNGSSPDHSADPHLAALLRRTVDTTGWRRFFTFGGRVRPSTTGLCVALLGLIILKGYALEQSAEWNLETPPIDVPAVTSAPVTTQESVTSTNPQSSPAQPPSTKPTITDEKIPATTPATGFPSASPTADSPGTPAAGDSGDTNTGNP